MENDKTDIKDSLILITKLLSVFAKEKTPVADGIFALGLAYCLSLKKTKDCSDDEIKELFALVVKVSSMLIKESQI